MTGSCLLESGPGARVAWQVANSEERSKRLEDIVTSQRLGKFRLGLRASRLPRNEVGLGGCPFRAKRGTQSGASLAQGEVVCDQTVQKLGVSGVAGDEGTVAEDLVRSNGRDSFPRERLAACLAVPYRPDPALYTLRGQASSGYFYLEPPGSG